MQNTPERKAQIRENYRRNRRAILDQQKQRKLERKKNPALQKADREYRREYSYRRYHLNTKQERRIRETWTRDGFAIWNRDTLQHDRTRWAGPGERRERELEAQADEITKGSMKAAATAEGAKEECQEQTKPEP